MNKAFPSFFVIIASVMSSASAGFLSGSSAIYRAGVAAPSYAAATYVATPPVPKFVRAYAAGPPLTSYAATSYSAAPFYSADLWNSYNANSLGGGYVAAPVSSIKYLTPATAYHSTYIAPAAVYRASYAHPSASSYGYAAPAPVPATFSHAGYAQTTYSHSGYNYTPFNGFAAPAPVAPISPC